MRTLDRSDLWFGLVLAPFFAMAAFVVFGMFVTSASFWSMLPAIGLVLIANMMRGPLSRLGYAPRFFSWFCIGVTFAALGTLSGDREFSLAIAAGLGLAFVIIDFLAVRHGPKEKAVNG